MRYISATRFVVERIANRITLVPWDIIRAGAMWLTSVSFYPKNVPSSASFSFIFVFSNKHYSSISKFM